jgi:CRP-like cAMP-binding protein
MAKEQREIYQLLVGDLEEILLDQEVLREAMIDDQEDALLRAKTAEEVLGKYKKVVERLLQVLQMCSDGVATEAVAWANRELGADR